MDKGDKNGQDRSAWVHYLVLASVVKNINFCVNPFVSLKCKALLKWGLLLMERFPPTRAFCFFKLEWLSRDNLSSKPFVLVTYMTSVYKIRSET